MRGDQLLQRVGNKPLTSHCAAWPNKLLSVRGLGTVGCHNMASKVCVTHGTEALGSGTGLGGRGGALIPVSTELGNIGRLCSLVGREAASDGAAGLYFSDDL